ncbi:hypothetical protein HOB10_03405 [Candidatus Parcubacteria bacterium]|jgi:hypothetical protein|nr:hypothetical protein [Candidatus Parcubacteria bacterium]
MLDQATRSLRVMGAATMLRSLHTLRGVTPESFYTRLRLVGHPEDMIEDIQVEVERQGGPLMSEDETFSAVVGAMELRRRGLA